MLEEWGIPTSNFDLTAGKDLKLRYRRPQKAGQSTEYHHPTNRLDCSQKRYLLATRNKLVTLFFETRGPCLISQNLLTPFQWAAFSCGWTILAISQWKLSQWR